MKHSWRHDCGKRTAADALRRPARWRRQRGGCSSDELSSSSRSLVPDVPMLPALVRVRRSWFGGDADGDRRVDR